MTVLLDHLCLHSAVWTAIYLPPPSSEPHFFFQVRDQRASLSHDPRQGMMVEFVDNERRQAGRGSVHPLQFIMSFTMQEWDVMKKLVKPNETKVLLHTK